MDSQPFIEKMRAADLPELAIRIFEQYYNKLGEGETGLIAGRDIEPVGSLPDREEFPPELSEVINSRGVVLSAGTYLEAPTKRRRLSPGLGARHTAALSITAVTDAVATVVSSSSGKVTVFFEGRPILELEKPEPLVKP
jgi:hypothetical protein